MNIELSHIKNVYFLGIGGIGMSALARWFKNNHYHVAGYDAVETQLTKELEKEGIDIHYQQKVGRIPTLIYQKHHTLVIYTPAIPEDNVEFQFFKSEQYQMMKRSEALGIITRKQQAFCVAGTHGKTTTSTILTHLLKTIGVDCSAFLGGISANYHTNILMGSQEEPVVIEADEYDRSFHRLSPYSTIVTTVDADHLDIYGTDEEVLNSFRDYLDLVAAKVIIHQEAFESLSIAKTDKIITYGSPNSDYSPQNIQVNNGRYIFDLVKKDNPIITGLTLNVPGKHNVLNATAALVLCLESGFSQEELLKKGIETFKGVARRFQTRFKENGKVLVDDYAHHPTELKALINTANELYPNRKVTIVFQPHLYSRTKDFKEQFGEALSLADEVILLELYPARELPLPGISSTTIAEYVQKPCRVYSKQYFLEAIDSLDFEVLLMAGAGDIDKVIIESVRKLEQLKLK